MTVHPAWEGDSPGQQEEERPGRKCAAHLHSVTWEEGGVGLQGVSIAGKEGWGQCRLGSGEGQVPLLRVCPASLACPVLPKGRNQKNDEDQPQPQKHDLQGCQREWLVWKPGRTFQLMMSLEDPAIADSYRGPFISAP